MNQRQTLYTRYPDLLTVNSDMALEEVVAGFDQLCNKQPPPELVNLSLSQSFEARQAETFSQSPAWQTGTDGLFRPDSFYPTRYRFRRIGLWVSLGFLLMGSFVLFASSKNHPTSMVMEAQPVCASPRMAAIKQNANTYTIGCVSFSIQNPEVDADRITIKYTASGRSNFSYVPAGIRLTDEQGRELKHLGSVPPSIMTDPGQFAIRKGLPSEDTAPFYDGNDQFYNGKEVPVAPLPPGYVKFGRTDGEEWFDVSSLAGSSKGSVKKLRLEIASFSYQNGDGLLPSVDGPFTFDFAVAIPTDASKVVTLNQADTYNGSTATLEKVAVMPGYTRFYLRGVDSNLDYELRAGTTYLDSRSLASPNSTTTSQITTTTEGLTVITVRGPLLGVTGEWTLIVKPQQAKKPYTTQSAQGPWLFRFTLNPSTSAKVETSPTASSEKK